MTPDAKCSEDLPAGVVEARALIAYTDRAAADLLDLSASYVRPDGQLVGTGSQVAAAGLLTGPWVTAANRSSAATIWVGATSPSLSGTPESTCNDWTSTVGRSPAGISYSVLDFWYYFSTDCAPASDFHLYCVEQ
jgi:hypothetical protein